MKEMKTIAYFTEKGGVSPATRVAVKNDALKMAGIDLANFEKVGDYYVMPICKDFSTGETLYLKVSASVGLKPVEKVSKKPAKVSVPSLF